MIIDWTTTNEAAELQRYIAPVVYGAGFTQTTTYIIANAPSGFKIRPRSSVLATEAEPEAFKIRKRNETFSKGQ